jgi:flagellar basal-body rod protein FlgB
MKPIEGEAPMFEKLELTRLAQSLAAYSGSRLAVIARNVANADTPGYRASDMRDFRDLLDQPDVALRTTRPGHLAAASPDPAQGQILSGGPMSPNGNDVSLDLQMQKAVEARQSHEMALAIYRSTSAIIRTSLGRNA